MIDAGRVPGLLSRRMFAIGPDRVVVEERWKIDEPGCPMIVNPWEKNALLGQGPHYVRQVEMSATEFSQSNIPLFG
jgi:hypothetical protein